MKTTKHLLSIGIVWLVTSCNVLEINPVSDILAENFYQNAGDAQAALMNVYNYIQGPVTQGFIAAPEAMGDAMRVVSGGNFTRHENFTPTPSQGVVGDVWPALYFAIHAANDVIESVPKINDPALNQNQVIGEAYFLRGMCFFYLTRLYGKIPLVTETSKSPDQDFNVNRVAVPLVYEQIIKDLKEAESRMDAPSQNRARASKGAARGLLAKVYLTRLDPGDYELALAKTEEVMSDPQYALVAGANYGDLFSPGKQNTKETILEISFRPNTSVESQALERETVFYPNNTPRLLPEKKLTDAFYENPQDLRIPASLGTFNNQIYARKYETAPPSSPARGTLTPNVIILRLADVILMRAECLNELGRPEEAIPFLNQIRIRASLVPTSARTQNEVRLALEKERFVELAFEGHRWFDLVRTGRAVDQVSQLTNPDRIIWPIPSREIDLNSNLLPQNPSY